MSSKSGRPIRLCHACCRGVTLLEMMVAVTISVLLMLLLTKIYLHMHRVLVVQHAIHLQQHHAQKLLDIMKSEISMAGHIGCAKISTEFIVDPLPPFSLSFENYLIVNRNNITVSYQSSPGVTLLNDVQGRSMIKTDALVHYRSGDVLVISDCEHAEIFLADIVLMRGNTQVIYTASPLHHAYHSFAEIGALVIHQYFVDSHQTLMRHEANGKRIALMSGVKDLTFSKDAGGVSVDFQTITQLSRQAWHGYVAKP